MLIVIYINKIFLPISTVIKCSQKIISYVLKPVDFGIKIIIKVKKSRKISYFNNYFLNFEKHKQYHTCLHKFEKPKKLYSRKYIRLVYYLQKYILLLLL